MSFECVFLLAVVRSGTTFVGNALATHPQIATFGEILFPSVSDPDITAFGWYNWLLGKIEADKNSITPESQNILFGEYIAWLRSRVPEKHLFLDLKLEQLAWATASLSSAIFKPEHGFVVLKRKNLLRIVVSSAVMFKRIEMGDPVVHRDYVPDKLAVRLDPTQVVKDVWNKRWLYNSFGNVSAQGATAFIEVDYDTLAGEAGASEFERIQKFIGVEPRELHTSIVRQNPYSLAEMVENFDEVVEALKRDGLGEYLEMP